MTTIKIQSNFPLEIKINMLNKINNSLSNGNKIIRTIILLSALLWQLSLFYNYVYLFEEIPSAKNQETNQSISELEVKIKLNEFSLQSSEQENIVSQLIKKIEISNCAITISDINAEQSFNSLKLIELNELVHISCQVKNFIPRSPPVFPFFISLV